MQAGSANFCHCVGQGNGVPCNNCPARGPFTTTPLDGPCRGCSGRGIVVILGQVYACTRCHGSGRESVTTIEVTCHGFGG